MSTSSFASALPPESGTQAGSHDLQGSAAGGSVAPPAKGSRTTAVPAALESQEEASWLPWLGLLGLTLVLTFYSSIRTEGTIFADAVEYLERAFQFARGELVVDAKQLRPAGITLLHLPILWLSAFLSSTFGIEETRWILPYAGLVHVGVTCLFIVATVHLGRALSEFIGQPAGQARVVGWFAGLVALASAKLLEFSAIPMADIGSAAALAYGLKRAFLGSTSARVGVEAGLGFGLAILAAFKTIPIVVVATLLAFLVRVGSPGTGTDGTPLSTFGQRLRATVVFSLAGTLVLGALLFAQCAFDGAAYGTFGIGLKNYVLANAAPGIAAWLYKIGFTELGHQIYFIGANAIEETQFDAISRNEADLKQIHPATFYFDNFGKFAPRWLVPFFGLGILVAIVRAAITNSSTFRGRFGRMVSASAPWVGAAALIVATTMKGTKEMRIWLPLLPAFAAYSALGLATIAGGKRVRAGRLRGAIVACALVAGPAHAVWTLSTFKQATAMAPLARAASWLNTYEPLLEKARSGVRPIVSSSYHWSVLFRTAPHLQLIKLTNQLDDSFSHLDTREKRETTLEELRGLDAFIVHSSLLRREAFHQGPEMDWAREIVDTLSRDFHVAAAFWERESDEREFGPVLVLTRETLPGEERRVLSAIERAAPPDGTKPLVRMERPLAGIFEQVELEEARAWWLPGDGLLWVEFALDFLGPELIADYLMLVRTTSTGQDQGPSSVRRPLWNKLRMVDLEPGTRLREGFVLGPNQGAINPGDTTEPVGPRSQIRVWLDLATVDATPEGTLFPTGRLEPLDPKWQPLAGPGTMNAERDQFDPATGMTDDGFHFTRDFGHLLIGQVPKASGIGAEPSAGNVLRVEPALAGQ